MLLTNTSDKNVFKKYLNALKVKPNLYICFGNSCNKKCDCDDDLDCDDCCSSKEKKETKTNSETIRDDGCFCRNCNEFLPMVEADDEGDGKVLCYKCLNPW